MTNRTKGRIALWCAPAFLLIALAVYGLTRLTDNRPTKQQIPLTDPCIACGELVSVRSPACPHCGQPFPQSDKIKSMLAKEQRNAEELNKQLDDLEYKRRYGWFPGEKVVEPRTK